MAGKQTDEKNEQSKKTPAKVRMLWLVATLACVAALVVGVQLTRGAFTGAAFLKAVAVTGTSQDLFASDVLVPYNSDPGASPALRSIVVDTNKDKCSVSFKIYNCLLDDMNVFNDKEVKYTLSVEAKDADVVVKGENGTEETRPGWSISPSPDTYTFSATHGEIRTYTITFDRELVDRASFTIKAVVDKDESPGTSKYCLAARVEPVKRSNANPASISGSWVDANAKRDNVGHYAAYNYRITVTGEEKTVEVTWGSKVELDKHFADNHSNAQFKGNSVTFRVKPGSEIINFYRRSGSADPTSWDDLGVHIEESNSQSNG